MKKYKFDIVALSETWLKNNKPHLVQVDGYKSEFKNKESKSGGIGFYIKEHMNFNGRHDLERIDESNEIL